MNYFTAGVEKYKSKDYIGSLEYFKLNLQERPYDINSLFYLIRANTRINNFKEARKIYADNFKLLDANKSNGINDLVTLELAETNYLAALDLIYKYLNQCQDLFTLKELARVNINLGNFTVARKIYETLILSDNERIKLQSFLYLMSFYMQIGDYEKAAYYCYSLDLDAYFKYYPKFNYFSFKSRLDAVLGKVYKDFYVPNILKTHDEELLINHIKEHCNPEDRNTIGCFKKDLDIPKLLTKVREILPLINGNFSDDSIIYYYRLDEPIGYRCGNETNDLCIVKHCSGQILSMYPCYLSDKFNEEGWLTSEKLRLKRERGMQNEK